MTETCELINSKSRSCRSLSHAHQRQHSGNRHLAMRLNLDPRPHTFIIPALSYCQNNRVTPNEHWGVYKPDDSSLLRQVNASHHLWTRQLFTIHHFVSPHQLLSVLWLAAIVLHTTWSKNQTHPFRTQCLWLCQSQATLYSVTLSMHARQFHTILLLRSCEPCGFRNKWVPALTEHYTAVVSNHPHRLIVTWWGCYGLCLT